MMKEQLLKILLRRLVFLFRFCIMLFLAFSGFPLKQELKTRAIYPEFFLKGGVRTTQENMLLRRTGLSLYWIFLSFPLKTWSPLLSSWSPRFSGKPFCLAVLPQPSLCDMTWSKWHTTCQPPVIFPLGMLQCAVYSVKQQQKKKTWKCVSWHANWPPLGKKTLLLKGRVQVSLLAACGVSVPLMCYIALLNPRSWSMSPGTRQKHRKSRLIPGEAVVVFLRQRKLPTWRKIFKV